MPQERLRIAMITSDYLDARHGGVETHIYWLSRTLIARGHDVEVIRISSEPSQREAPAGVPYRVVPIRRVVSVDRSRARGRAGLALELADRAAGNLQARTVERALRLPRGTVVHQHNFVASIRLTKRLARRGYPVEWTNHLAEFLMMRRSALGRFAIARMVSHFKGIMGPSRDLADVPGARVRPVATANGVDTDLFRPAQALDREAARAARGWKREDLVVCVPRRWAPQKGVVHVARAARALRDESGIRFVFVGSADPEYPAYASEVARALDGLPRVEVVPHLAQTELAELYRVVDVTAIPSLYEATSLAGLEAMASGNTVIATRVGGLPEIIDDGSTGLLVPPEDHVALAEAIRRVASWTPEEREAMGARARRDAVERFGWDRVADDAAAMYAAAIGP